MRILSPSTLDPKSAELPMQPPMQAHYVRAVELTGRYEDACGMPCHLSWVWDTMSPQLGVGYHVASAGCGIQCC